MFQRYQVTFSHAARQGLLDYANYLKRQGVNERQVNAIEQTIRQKAKSLGRWPYRHREGQIENTREFPIPGIEWVLIYRVNEENRLVEILALEHARTRL